MKRALALAAAAHIPPELPDWPVRQSTKVSRAEDGVHVSAAGYAARARAVARLVRRCG